MQKFRLTLLGLLLTSSFAIANSNYVVKNQVVNSNGKLCGELLDIPEGVVVHKVSQRRIDTGRGIGGDSKCSIQFVTTKSINLSGSYFEIIMYDGYDNSIYSVQRHQIQ